MEKLEFRSEAEKEIFMQLISKKEAIRLCFEQKDSSYMEKSLKCFSWDRLQKNRLPITDRY